MPGSARQLQAGGEGLAGFLQRRAPLWHQVGRVCFHLAENRRSEEFPFAFLATYAPSVASGSRVQYQPLSTALRELAGAEEQESPGPFAVAGATGVRNSSALVKELVDSGDLYQPLAWTPREAYRFLKDVPAASKRVAFWCGCPTGGRSAPARASVRRSATPGRTSSMCTACSTSKSNWRWATSSSARPNGAS